MKNLRRFSGLRAKRQGEEFEHRFYHQAQINGFECIRIPDGCRTVRDRYGKIGVMRIKSPFDFILLSEKKTLLVDTKSCESKHFARSKINYNQLTHLMRASRFHLAGYVVWFKKSDSVVFFHAKQLNGLRHGSSLSEAMGVHLGTLMNFDVRKIDFVTLSAASSL